MNRKENLRIPNPKISNGTHWQVFPDTNRNAVYFTNPNDHLAAVVRRGDSDHLEVSRLSAEDLSDDVLQRIESILTNVAEAALAGGEISLE